MDLVDKIKFLANLEKIDESKLILEEAEYFIEEHKGHGPYNIQLVYGNHELINIYLSCTAGDLIDTTKCSHNNNDVFVEYSFSIVYERIPTGSTGIQKDRREDKTTKMRITDYVP